MRKPFPKTVSIMQACELCGVSRRTIYNWLGANKVQFVRTAGGQVRIIESTLFQAGNVRFKRVDEARTA